jgi:hypothetical protein
MNAAVGRGAHSVTPIRWHRAFFAALPCFVVSPACILSVTWRPARVNEECLAARQKFPHDAVQQVLAVMGRPIPVAWWRFADTHETPERSGGERYRRQPQRGSKGRLRIFLGVPDIVKPSAVDMFVPDSKREEATIP